MNKRLVIIDDDPKAGNLNPLNYVNIGLPNIYTTTQIEGRETVVETKVIDPKSGLEKIKKEKVFIQPTMTELEKNQVFGNLGPSDAVMLIGPTAFSCLRKLYHFGIRNENYFDCSKLRRLSIEGGAFVKCIPEGIPDEEDINDFMSQDFATPRDFSWFKQSIIHTLNEAINFMNYMNNLDPNTNFGFDYEGSGMPWDKWYELSGYSLCTKELGAFVSLTDLRHTTKKEDYEKFLYTIVGPFLVKRMTHIWVYNESYEYQVSYRMLGVDLYNLCDASVFNVLSGNHLKKYSLKWSGNKYLETTVWDTEFDWISDTIDSMLFAEEGKLKKDKTKVLKVTKNTYQLTDEWKALCKRYPKYIDEFKLLIEEYFGNPFMCIPSDILGYYCNLDAFYTLMIFEVEHTKYTDQAINVFMDNIRLQTFLHSCGVNKWEEYRQDYEKYCKEQMVWGIQYCATARCKIKMNKHSLKMADLKKYPEIAKKLLKNNKFFNGDPYNITKYLLCDNIDNLDAYQYGINEGKLFIDYGPDFTVDFMHKVVESMEEVGFIKTEKKTGKKVLKTKIDNGIGNKKKFINTLSAKMIPIYGLDKIKLDNKHLELEKYLYYERAFNELNKVSEKQLSDINNIPTTIHAFGQNFDTLGYSDYISNNYFKCKSPIENDEICLEFAELFPTETAFLAAIFESTQQLNGAEKYYDGLGIKTIDEAYAHFMTDWQKWCNSMGPDGEYSYNSKLYPQKMFTLSLQYWQNICKRKKDEKVLDQVKEVWDNFNGYTAQEQFFKYVDNEYLNYGKHFEEIDMGNNFYFMRKLVINYLLYKKYAKVLTTYIGTVVDGDPKGMFLQTDKWVIEDPKTHIVLREAGPGEPGAVCKMFAKFQCMEKSSKRWSSGYHKLCVALRSNSKMKRA